MSNKALRTITVAFLAFGMSVAVSVKVLTGKTYVKLAAGMVDNPINVVPVLKTSQCARLCAKLKLCSAFSLRNNDMMNSTNDSKTGDINLECHLTQGQFTWTPDPMANIFGEVLDGRYTNGYSFARDGMLYKFVMISNFDQTNTRTLCNNEAASIAVPYPNVSLQAIVSVQMASSGQFYVGLTRTGSHAEGRWVTDDGQIFFVNSQTTAQVRWLFGGNTNNPSGDGQAADWRITSKLVNDLSPGHTATSLMCRKEIYFMRSSINGKFYRLFRNKRTYAQAVESCASFGGTLANVYSAGDFNATEGYRLQTMFFSQPALEGFWVGGTDEEVEGTWILPDGTRMLEADRLTDTNQIRLWATGQPTTGQSANCLSMSSARGNAQACNSTFRYLCEAVLN